MKMFKKIAGMLLTICLLVPCFSIMTLAANRIMFEDPTTRVGETLKLKGVLEADSAIEDRTIVMSYDTDMLKFVSGDNVTETAAGKLTYKVTGKQDGRRVEFYMNFTVLKEGTTKVSVDSHEVWSTSNQALTCQEGNSTIKIEAGEAPTVPTDAPTDVPGEVPAEAVTVIVDEKTYLISDDYEKTDIPKGYEEGTLEYEGRQIKVVTNSSSGVSLAYLKDTADLESEGAFYVYHEEDATFAPYKEIKISDTLDVTITILSNVEEVTVPKECISIPVIMDGLSFPGWQIESGDDESVRCIVYAVNSEGVKALYQYDTDEGTFQRFVPTVVETDNADDSMFKRVLEDNFDMILIIVGAVFVVMLLILIVLAVKLYNRNAELDELYDEYGIDLDEEGTIVRDEDEEEFFIRIEDESVEAIETVESVEIEEEENVPNEEELETISGEPVEDFDELPKREDITPPTSIKEDIDVIAKYLSDDKKETLFEDEVDDDFEMDFIDLDD